MDTLNFLLFNYDRNQNLSYMNTQFLAYVTRARIVRLENSFCNQSSIQISVGNQAMQMPIFYSHVLCDNYM